VTYQFGEANNALVYPGLGLGTIVAGASTGADSMLLAAAEAVAGQVDVSAPGALLLPAVENLRASSATTAVAVARAAADDGVATKKPNDLVQAVQDATSSRSRAGSRSRPGRWAGRGSAERPCRWRAVPSSSCGPPG
jgi:malate dehydrogenase (oxaloacetate-decarboxylating)